MLIFLLIFASMLPVALLNSTSSRLSCKWNLNMNETFQQVYNAKYILYLYLSKLIDGEFKMILHILFFMYTMESSWKLLNIWNQRTWRQQCKIDGMLKKIFNTLFALAYTEYKTPARSSSMQQTTFSSASHAKRMFSPCCCTFLDFA